MELEDLLNFSDAYMTIADNYYLYNDPERSGRMIYILSDLDSTIRYTLFYMDLMLSGDYSKHPGFNFQPLTIKLFSNPKFLQRYKDIILRLAKELIHPSITKSGINSTVNMIRVDVEWDQSLKRFGKDFRKIISMNPTQLKSYPPGLNFKSFGSFETFPFD